MSSIPTKPKFSEPCNGCGRCCAEELCDIADHFFEGSPLPCPALEYDEGRMWCGLVRHPSRHIGLPYNGDEILTPLFAQMIAVGQGCGMPDEKLVQITRLEKSEAAHGN